MPRYQVEPTQRTRGEKLQKLRQRVFATYGDICWLCGGGEADTIDHVIPLSNGGDDDINNLRPAHGRKSSSCVGNYSRKRPAYTGQKPMIKKQSSDEPDGITYGDEWICKKRGGMRSTMFLDVTALNIADPFVQAFINS